MVDVCIRFRKSPLLRILAKVRSHVFVNFFLKVDPGFTKGADHDIRAGARFYRRIAVRVRKFKIFLRVIGG